MLVGETAGRSSLAMVPDWGGEIGLDGMGSMAGLGGGGVDGIGAGWGCGWTTGGGGVAAAGA